MGEWPPLSRHGTGCLKRGKLPIERCSEGSPRAPATCPEAASFPRSSSQHRCKASDPDMGRVLHNTEGPGSSGPRT